MLLRTACRISASLVVPELGLEQSLDRRPHAVDDRLQIARLGRAWAAQLLEGGHDRPALGVAEHHHQPRAEPRRGELDAADLRRRDDVSGHADHEQIAQALVEHDLRGHARVGAPEDDRERLLGVRQLGPPGLTQERRRTVHVGREPEVPGSEPAERLGGRDHRCAAVTGAVGASCAGCSSHYDLISLHATALKIPVVIKISGYFPIHSEGRIQYTIYSIAGKDKVNITDSSCYNLISLNNSACEIGRKKELFEYPCFQKLGLGCLADQWL